MTSVAKKADSPDPIPSKGDRIELLRTQLGVRICGTVYYSDQIQVLVRWGDGRSQSLRVGVDRYQIIGEPGGSSGTVTRCR